MYCIVHIVLSSKQAQDLKENLVDIPDDTEKQEESIAKKNIENQAQNYYGGRFGDTDDTLHINGKREYKELSNELELKFILFI